LRNHNCVQLLSCKALWCSNYYVGTEINSSQPTSPGGTKGQI
jgi:hypothetical protein